MLQSPPSFPIVHICLQCIVKISITYEALCSHEGSSQPHTVTPLHHVAVFASSPEKPQLLHTMGSSSQAIHCFVLHILHCCLRNALPCGYRAHSFLWDMDVEALNFCFCLVYQTFFARIWIFFTKEEFRDCFLLIHTDMYMTLVNKHT